MRVMAWMRAGLLSVSLQRRAGARPGPPRAGARGGGSGEGRGSRIILIKSRGDLCQEPIDRLMA